MKKYFQLFCFAFLFASCSQDSIDEWNSLVDGVNPNSKITMKINDTSYQEYLDSNESLSWNKSLNSNGTYNYLIDGYIQTNGLLSFSSPKYINFYLGANIHDGQIINVNTPEFQFSILGNGLETSEYHFVNGTSSGQIKITHFDGVTISGEFSFSKIFKYIENPKIGENLTNNTISGTFTKILKNTIN
jgi:hypothetical protein